MPKLQQASNDTNLDGISRKTSGSRKLPPSTQSYARNSPSDRPQPKCLTCNVEVFGSFENHKSPKHALDGVELCYTMFNGYQHGVYYYKTDASTSESQRAPVSSEPKSVETGNDPATGQTFRWYVPRPRNMSVNNAGQNTPNSQTSAPTVVSAPISQSTATPTKAKLG